MSGQVYLFIIALCGIIFLLAGEHGRLEKRVEKLEDKLK